MRFLKKYPLPAAGLILSLFALGNLLLSYGKNLRLVCGGIAFACGVRIEIAFFK